MTSIKTLFIIIALFLCSLFLKSQNCSYSVTNNYAIALDTDLVFKTIIYYNVQTLKYDTMVLKMDIVKPVEDNNMQRPIIIYFHGMNESYKYSQLHVKRMVDVMVRERGFVLASVDYKFWALPFVESTPSTCGNLLFLLNGVYSPYDNLEAQRADFRVTQDANDAISYVKSRSALDSSCVNLCFAAGFSAGGLVAGSSAFMSPAEKPLAAGNITPANYTNLFGSALTPTVSIPRQDLGPVYGNTNTLSPAVKGLLLFNSGLHNKNLIQQNDVPIFIYHSLNDPNIPFDSSNTTCFTDSKIYGQNVLKAQALNNGYSLNQSLVLLNGNTNHDFFNTQIRSAANFVSNQISSNQCQCDTTSTTSIIESTQNGSIKIYAFNDKITIANSLFTNLQTQIVIYNVYGQIVSMESILLSQKYIYETKCSPGVYYIEIKNQLLSKTQKVLLSSND